MTQEGACGALWGRTFEKVERVANDINKAGGHALAIKCDVSIRAEVDEALKNCEKPITVAVMGCVVNGPGEARAADVGIAGGDGEGLLFRHGEILRKVPQDKLVDALMDEIDKL